MDAAALNAFCAVKELTFVETGVKQGAKGAWFEDRKRARRFFAESELEEAVRKLKPVPPLFVAKPGDIQRPAA